MKSKGKIREMALKIQDQMKEYKSGVVKSTLEQRIITLAWVLEYPGVSTLVLEGKRLKMLECF